MKSALVTWSVLVATATSYVFGYKIVWSLFYNVNEAISAVFGL